MKKLTAGIFAGILTIVTVNAADAAIASKAYVDQERDVVKGMVGTLTNLETSNKTSTVAAINEVKGAVDTNKTNITSLQETVDGLTNGAGSVADQIADALGADFPENSTVQAELDKKADKTALETTNTKVTANTTAIDTITKDGGTIDTRISEAKTGLETKIGEKQDKSKNAYSVGTANGGWQALTDDELGALQSGIKSADVTQITTNKTDIAGIKTNIGTVPENKTVVGLIEEAKTAAGTDLTGKLGNLGEGNNTVADALAKKQNLLDNTNVKVAEDSTGNAVTAVTAENGTVTVTLGKSFIEQTKTTGAAGHYVLTADVSETGVTNYQWEKIDRATSESTGS